jgi:hypothetical protein
MMNPNEPNYGQLPASPPAQPMYPPAPQPTPTPANPYDFIVNPPAQPKQTSLGGGNKALRLLIGIGGIAVVLIVAAVVLTSVFAKGESPESLTSIVQQQQEIVRIATLGEQQSTSDTTKNLAYNIDLSVSTSQSQLVSYLAARGTKLDEKQLVLKQDAKTDTLLANAKATSTYDSALNKVLVAQLQAYLSDLQKAFDTTSSLELKKILKQNYQAGKTLLAQASTAPVQ